MIRVEQLEVLPFTGNHPVAVAVNTTVEEYSSPATAPAKWSSYQPANRWDA
ncbi:MULTISPECIES: hypothetical protein [Mycobacterium]|uniref:Uncharacterized protein n=1 Tax=Mycobacterium kiyosense TaxID=2871094 RepID=A0AA37Q5E0_9MYCO|nr:MULTISPECIES: hypothetical protein [Mycobacterium]ETA91810.1 hypothetical protein O982_25080 [Mycobacterium avium 10-5581]QWY63708.1 hypothetical protein BJP74_24300 [Mycobacterium avium subsp. hominissuis]QWY65101.1 hypothetical protein BJP78_25215 [Mycobacterium avium subsp. hominissuis]BAN91893.1 hypothetical protein MAH_p61 [Mycobacterium avium subsp. hominissuis TH135]GLB86932.1 hypothetical protein SRL2020028_61880 [Mycobacterium kiyosense]